MNFLKILKPRKKDSHKGDYGHVLIVAGSVGKLGAALMTCRAALRTGSGLVTLALPDKAFKKIPKNLLEVMYLPLPSDKNGEFSGDGDMVSLSNHGRPKYKDKTVIAVGPGMGTGPGSRKIVQSLLKTDLPLVIDADGLNCLALEKLKGLKGRRAPTILTPHPGEMIRLLSVSPLVPGTFWPKGTRYQKPKVDRTRQFAKKYGVHLVLKGYRTVIASPEGKISINPTGNPAMATAGMGDVLTGMIASLIGQDPFSLGSAIRAAVYLHGLIGDRWAARHGDRGMMAGDLIEGIPDAIRHWV
ncbi:MAG: NAD(P)H-hydrate dehydratase [Deltaproteobacteria bacterium]|nr:NAD(P)H-hydrate dehydratase [Deltaproteobacteria bacterium]